MEILMYCFQGKRAMLNSGLRKNHITTGIYPLYNYRLILYIIVNRVKGLF